MDDQAVVIDISSLSKGDQLKLRAAFAVVACSTLLVEDMVKYPWKPLLLIPVPIPPPPFKLISIISLTAAFYAFSPTAQAKRGREFLRNAFISNDIPPHYQECIILKGQDHEVCTKILLNAVTNDIHSNGLEIKKLVKDKTKEAREMASKILPRFGLRHRIEIDPFSELNNFELKM